MRRPAQKHREVAQAEARRLACYEKALQMLPDWGEAGMPPISSLGVGIGILVGLARKGFAEELPRDTIGDPRFRPTPAALAPDALTKLREMFR